MKNRFLLVVVSVLIAIVLGFGGIYLLALGIRSARALVVSHSITVDLGTVNYLSAYFKMIYTEELREDGVPAEDTEEFWESLAPDGRSYGEHFDESFRLYIAALVANADIYSAYHGYTAEDKLNVAVTTDEILALYAEGSVSVFNAMADKYDFDYNDFQNAAALLYKASRARDYIYGEGGIGIASHTDLCEQYFAEYVRVSVVYISKSQIYDTDEDGNFLYDENGKPVLRNMTDEEREERKAIIDYLQEAMNEGRLDADMIEEYLQYSDCEPEMIGKDHYFHPKSESNTHFHDHFTEVVSLTSGMEEGDIVMLTTANGVFFIHKKAIDKAAYTNEENICLADFYAMAADYYYEQAFIELMLTVSFNDRFDRLSPITVPEINDFYVREYKKFW